MAKNPKLIAITSGKGGTGKSSICYGIGYTLAKQGNRTLIIELDFGLRCLDIMFGMSGKVQYDLGDVLSGKKKILDAVCVVPTASNLNIVCAPRDAFMKVTAEEVVEICRSVRQYVDYIIIDTMTINAFTGIFYFDLCSFQLCVKRFIDNSALCAYA